MEEEFQASLRNVLDLLFRHEAAWPFRAPVTEAIAPGYFSIVSHPMDLSTMMARLEGKKYIRKADLQADLDLMLKNCRTYNIAPVGNTLLQAADAVEQAAQLLLQDVQDVPWLCDNASESSTELDISFPDPNTLSLVECDGAPVAHIPRPFLRSSPFILQPDGRKVPNLLHPGVMNAFLVHATSDSFGDLVNFMDCASQENSVAGHVNFACKDVDVKNPDDMESESRTIKEWKKHVGLSADDDVLSQNEELTFMVDFLAASGRLRQHLSIRNRTNSFRSMNLTLRKNQAVEVGRFLEIHGSPFDVASAATSSVGVSNGPSAVALPPPVPAVSVKEDGGDGTAAPEEDRGSLSSVCKAENMDVGEANMEEDVPVATSSSFAQPCRNAFRSLVAASPAQKSTIKSGEVKTRQQLKELVEGEDRRIVTESYVDILLLDAGFDGASVQSSQVLTDLLETFLLRCGRLCRNLQDARGGDLSQSSLIPALSLCGLGNVRQLKHWVKNDSTKRRERLLTAELTQQEFFRETTKLLFKDSMLTKSTLMAIDGRPDRINYGPPEHATSAAYHEEKIIGHLLPPRHVELVPQSPTEWMIPRHLEQRIAQIHAQGMPPQGGSGYPVGGQGGAPPPPNLASGAQGGVVLGAGGVSTKPEDGPQDPQPLTTGKKGNRKRPPSNQEAGGAKSGRPAAKKKKEGKQAGKRTRKSDSKKGKRGGSEASTPM